MKRCVVLDAMGVIFEAADDVVELLVPFVREHGGATAADRVEAAYREASLGRIGPDEFWTSVGLSPALEDAYLQRHRLSPGVLEFLEAAAAAGLDVWCLSNDVGRWSARLRTALGVDAHLAGAVISGDVGSRKPDESIYRRLAEVAGVPLNDMWFFDDRERNVAVALRLGMTGRLFTPEFGFRGIAETVLDRSR